MKYMHNLASIAITNKIPIIVTNIVRNIGDHEKDLEAGRRAGIKKVIKI